MGSRCVDEPLKDLHCICSEVFELCLLGAMLVDCKDILDRLQ